MPLEHSHGTLVISLGRLFQCSSTLIKKKNFLIYSLNLSWLSVDDSMSGNDTIIRNHQLLVCFLFMPEFGQELHVHPCSPPGMPA